MKIKVAMKAENHLIGSLITPLTVTRTFLGPARSLCSQSHTPWKLRDRGVEHLPGAKGHSAVTDGKGEMLAGACIFFIRSNPSKQVTFANIYQVNIERYYKINI